MQFNLGFPFSISTFCTVFDLLRCYQPISIITFLHVCYQRLLVNLWHRSVVMLIILSSQYFVFRLGDVVSHLSLVAAMEACIDHLR